MNDTPGQIPERISPPLPAAPPANWRTALADLLGSRAALVQYELKEAAATNVRRIVLFATAAIFLLIFWLVLVAGLVGLISAQGGYLWYTVALIAAGIHFLLAVILILIAKRSTPPSFTITRQEFKKDREWLQTFQSPGKSND